MKVDLNLGKISGTQGWQQIVNSKVKMVNAYEEAKGDSQNDKVRTSHGCTAEAIFREWLKSFLPKRFRVTAGKIICQVFKDDQVAPYYDVIIYDQLTAPILWTESNPDKSKSGMIRAIPAECVYAVLEVKSRFSPKSSKDAIQKLNELAPLFGRDDKMLLSGNIFPPKNFYSAVIFFELQKADQYRLAALNNLFTLPWPPAFSGGLILNGEGQDNRKTGLIAFGEGDTPYQLGHGKKRWSMFSNITTSDSLPTTYGKNICLICSWAISNFALFAFELVARLNGTQQPGKISSYHGIVTAK
jgi:hypothetical protein